MQKFKSIDQLFEPDSAMTSYRHRDTVSGSLVTQDEFRLHKRVSVYCLSDDVPEQIRSYFDTGRNLLVFSYFEYGFVPIAAFLASSAVEMALRTIYPPCGTDLKGGKDRRGFKDLLGRAIKDRRIRESDFKSLVEDRAKQRAAFGEFGEAIGKTITVVEKPYESVYHRTAPEIRNFFAHPRENHTLIPPEMAIGIFKRSSEAINQLFKDRSEFENGIS